VVTILELILLIAGTIISSIGFYMLSPPLGLIIFGGLLIIISWPSGGEIE